MTPAATTITFTYQSFTVKATYIAAIDEPGAIILLRIEPIEPLTIVCSFAPVLQPMWPAGLVLPLVRGLLGLESEAAEKRIVFEPRFPADWDRVSIDNYRVGSGIFSFRWIRRGGKVTVDVASPKKSGFRLAFAPVLGPGTNVLGAEFKGRPVPFKLGGLSLSQAVQPSLEVGLSGNDIFELNIEPAVEILPPIIETKTGDLDWGLKIIKTELRENVLVLTLEGLTKEIYKLALTHPERIVSVQGARLEAGPLPSIYF